MGVFLLGAEIYHHPCISDSAIFGDVGDLSVSHNKNGVGAFLPSHLTSLCDPSKIFAEGPVPDIFRSGVMHEFFITADCLACGGMDHWHRNLG